MYTPPKEHNNLFRESALNQLNAAPEVPEVLQVVSPSDVWGMTGVLLILLAILLWGLFGRVYLSATGVGILLSSTHVIAVEQAINQRLAEKSGIAVQLEELYQKKKAMYEKHYLILDDLLKAKKDYLLAREEVNEPNRFLLMKTQADMKSSKVNTSLQAIVFMDQQQGKKIRVGMPAYLLPKNQSQYDRGYIKGQVSAISRYPVSKSLAYSYLGNINLIDDFFVSGAPYMVKIAMKQQALDSLQVGCIVDAKVTFEEISPVQLISHA